MTRVLFDTNVLLDLLLEREPWAEDAKALYAAHLDGRLLGHITATTLTDVFYIARRHAGRERAWDAVRLALDQFAILAVGRNRLTTASGLPGEDFEDNLQLACATSLSLDAIVTRDPAGLGGTTIEVLSPPELLNRI